LPFHREIALTGALSNRIAHYAGLCKACHEISWSEAKMVTAVVDSRQAGKPAIFEAFWRKFWHGACRFALVGPLRHDKLGAMWRFVAFGISVQAA
jgi:hypothetical protein